MAEGSSACNICGTANPEFLLRASRSPGPIVRCRNCGFIYVSPIEKPELFFDDASSRVSEEQLQGDRWWMQWYLMEEPQHRANFRYLLGQIEKLNEPGRLLDLGCYCGFLLDEARARGWSTVGIEPEHMAHDYAVDKLGLTVYEALLRAAPIPPDSVDVVTSLQVFEHLPDPTAVLRDIKRVLRPGGLIVIEVPNIDCLAFRLLKGRWRGFGRHHVNYFSPRSLSELLNRNGFRVARTELPSKQMSLGRMGFFLYNFYPSVGRVLSPLAGSRTIWKIALPVDLGDVLRIYAYKC